METHYETLGISAAFPSEAIEGVRRALSKIYHPDAGSAPDAERMAQINVACDVLGDVQSRARYDRTLELRTNSMRASPTVSESARPSSARVLPNTDTGRVRLAQQWTLPVTLLPQLPTAVRDVLDQLDIRVTRESGGEVTGIGGSLLRCNLMWTDKTAPYCVRIGFRRSGPQVVVDASFTERFQVAKFGQPKLQRYHALAAQLFTRLENVLDLLVEP